MSFSHDPNGHVAASDATMFDLLTATSSSLFSSAFPTTTNSITALNPTQRLHCGLIEVTFNCLCNSNHENMIIGEIELSNNANESLLVTAINNYAICCLFLKRIGESVQCLESLIKENPSVYLIDPVVFNLCTMYDLTCAPDISAFKKKALQQMANYYCIEDPLLHWRSFRLTNSS